MHWKAWVLNGSLPSVAGKGHQRKQTSTMASWVNAISNRMASRRSIYRVRHQPAKSQSLKKLAPTDDTLESDIRKDASQAKLSYTHGPLPIKTLPINPLATEHLQLRRNLYTNTLLLGDGSFEP
jgi:hypothetical protein